MVRVVPLRDDQRAESSKIFDGESECRTSLGRTSSSFGVRDSGPNRSASAPKKSDAPLRASAGVAPNAEGPRPQAAESSAAAARKASRRTGFDGEKRREMRGCCTREILAGRSASGRPKGLMVATASG